MVAETQIALNKLDIAAFKYEAAKIINKITSKNIQKSTKEEQQKSKTIRNIRNKLKNNILHIKADKSNTIVLIDKNEYIAKTVTFIQENYFSEITKGPTEKY